MIQSYFIYQISVANVETFSFFYYAGPIRDSWTVLLPMRREKKKMPFKVHYKCTNAGRASCLLSTVIIVFLTVHWNFQWSSLDCMLRGKEAWSPEWKLFGRPDIQKLSLKSGRSVRIAVGLKILQTLCKKNKVWNRNKRMNHWYLDQNFKRRAVISLSMGRHSGSISNSGETILMRHINSEEGELWGLPLLMWRL